MTESNLSSARLNLTLKAHVKPPKKHDDFENVGRTLEETIGEAIGNAVGLNLATPVDFCGNCAYLDKFKSVGMWNNV